MCSDHVTEGRVLATRICVNVQDAMRRNPKMTDVNRKKEGEIIARELYEVPHDEARPHGAAVVGCKEKQKQLVIADGKGLVRRHNSGANPRRRRRHEIMDEKKAIELLVLPPPHLVSGYNRHQQTHESKKSVGNAKPERLWECAKVNDSGDEEGGNSDVDGLSDD